MECVDHGQTERAFSVEYIRYVLPAAEEGFHSLAGQALLFHAVFYRFDGIRWVDGFVLVFPGFGQRNERVQPVVCRRAGLGVPEPVYFR